METRAAVCDVCKSVEGRLGQIHQFGSSLDDLLGKMQDIKKSLKHSEKVLIGVSGGVDSSYVALAAGLVKLPVVLIHFDNGWNTQLAVHNINSIVNSFNFELHTVIQDWDTFKSLQRSFLFSGVPDIEVVSDHAIFSILLDFLNQRKDIRYVLSGGNFATEHGLDQRYVWSKWDQKNIRSINANFDNTSLAKYPTASLWRWSYYRSLSRKQKVLSPLNAVYYQRSYAVQQLSAQLGFVDYEFKHEESLITKVFQRTILPTKYNYYKIKDHLSALIRNKECSKPEALEALERFRSSKINEYELEYFLDKLDLSRAAWDKILHDDPREHSHYKNSKLVFDAVTKVAGALKLRAMT